MPVVIGASGSRGLPFLKTAMTRSINVLRRREQENERLGIDKNPFDSAVIRVAGAGGRGRAAGAGMCGLKRAALRLNERASIVRRVSCPGGQRRNQRICAMVAPMSSKSCLHQCAHVDTSYLVARVVGKATRRGRLQRTFPHSRRN